MSIPAVPAVLERIRERDEQRQAALQTRGEADFHDSELIRQCADLEHDVRAALAAAERGMKELTNPADEAAAKLLLYEKAVTGACSHLPTYEAQKLHAHVKGFKEQLLQLRAQAVSKKRFSFVRKPDPAILMATDSVPAGLTQSGSKARTEDGSEPHRSVSNGQDSAIGSGCSRARPGDMPADHSRSSAASKAAAQSAKSTRCISGRTHETIQHTLDGEGGPLVIRDLTSCTVCVRGQIDALRMHNLRDCTLIAGPVHGSAFVEGVDSSTVILDCSQARIHRSKHATFLLRVVSHPIIEHSTGLRFGPLPGETQKTPDNSMWRQVQDFGWLRNTPSPNWTVLSDECALNPEIKAMLRMA